MVVVFLTESADWTQVAVVEIVRHALQLVMPSATAQQVSNAKTIVSMILYHCSCVIMLDFQIRCKSTTKKRDRKIYALVLVTTMTFSSNRTLRTRLSPALL